MRPLRLCLPLLLLLAGLCAAAGRAEEAGLPAIPTRRLAPGDPAWDDLAEGLQRRTCVTASFTEARQFPFRKTPTLLRGELRVSAERGLSLHYLAPEDRTVIIDGRGVLLRSAAGDSAPPADPRTAAANSALLHALRLDLGPLAETFDAYGSRAGAAWTLALVPRAADLRRALGTILVDGVGDAVQRVEMRRSATQRVDITVGRPVSAAAFTADELRRYFR